LTAIGILSAPTVGAGVSGLYQLYKLGPGVRVAGLRRIQLRRARSIASWAIMPWLIVAAAIFAVFCIY
jgi:hypothetical protein